MNNLLNVIAHGVVQDSHEKTTGKPYRGCPLSFSGQAEEHEKGG